MNYLSLGVLVITLFTVAVGALLGLARGWKRSVLRLILVAVSGAGALIMQRSFTNALMNINVEGQTFQEYLQSQLPAEIASASELMLSIVMILVGIFAFVLLFLAFQFLTWIVFCILKLVLRPLLGRKSGRLIGALVGAVTGCLIAFLICVPFNGLFLEVAKLERVEINNEQLIKDLPGEVSFIGYGESAISKVYTPIGGGFYKLISTGKDGAGKNVNLSAQVDAAVAGSKMADTVQKMSQVDFSSGLTESNIADLRSTLEELDAIKGDMTPEAREALNEMLHSVVDSLETELPVDISEIDFSEVNFTNEGALLENLYEYQNTGTVSDVNGMVKTLSESTLVLPILAESDVSVALPEEEKAEVAGAIESLEGADAETVAKLKDVFGING